MYKRQDLDIPGPVKTVAGWLFNAAVDAGVGVFAAQDAAAEKGGELLQPAVQGAMMMGIDAVKGVHWALSHVMLNQWQEEVGDEVIRSVDDSIRNGTISDTIAKTIVQTVVFKRAGAAKVLRQASKGAPVAAGAGNAVDSVSIDESLPELKSLCREQGFIGLLESACIDALETLSSSETPADIPIGITVDPEALDAGVNDLLTELESMSVPAFGRAYWRKRYAADGPAQEEQPTATDAGTGSSEDNG